MKDILIVGLGGFAGSVARYLVSVAMLPLVASTGFPFATLAVNVAGSLLIGAFAAAGIPGGWYFLCVTGFCGGFTTFSTFSLEAVNLMRTGSGATALVYMLVSFVASALAVGLGFWLGTKLGTFK